jgi:hypothetical protein
MSSQSAGSKWKPQKIEWSDEEIASYNASIDKAEQEMGERLEGWRRSTSHQLLKRLKMPEDEATINKREPSRDELYAARISSDRFEYDPDKRQACAKRVDAKISRKSTKPLKIRKEERIATWARRNDERDAKIARMEMGRRNEELDGEGSAPHEEDPNHKPSEDQDSPYILCGSPTGDTDDDM